MCCPVWPVKDVEYEGSPRCRRKRMDTAYRYQWNGTSWDLQRMQVPAVSRNVFLFFFSLLFSPHLFQFPYVHLVIGNILLSTRCEELLVSVVCIFFSSCPFS